MKRILWLLALAVVALSCETLMGGGSEKVDPEILQREHWSVCGMKAPREYQELNRFSYDYNPADEEDGYVGAEADFKDGKMTIVFPSGAFRVLKYTLSSDGKSVTFDKPLHYGHYGAKDITACKVAEDKMNIGDIFALMGYRGVKTEDSHFICFYEGSSLSGVDMSKGEWRLNFVSGHLKDELVPLHEIDCEYGTAWKPTTLFDDAPAWAMYYADSGAAMPWAADYDLARIYYGPAWRLPTRAEAQRLIDECIANKHNRVLREDGEIIDNRTGIIFIPKEDTSRDFFMEVGPNEGDERGFWLADGSAFVGKIDSGNKVSVSIVTETAGKSYCVLPVKP